VVHVKAACEAEPRRERKRADERAGAIAARVQDRRERVDRRRETEAGVVADAVIDGIAPRENVRVRRQRDDVVRVRAIEADAPRGKAIDPGRLRGVVPGRADRVGAQRVDSNKEYVDRPRARPWRGLIRSSTLDRDDRRERQHRAPQQVKPIGPRGTEIWSKTLRKKTDQTF